VKGINIEEGARDPAATSDSGHADKPSLVDSKLVDGSQE